ncbi:BTB and MATH domain-containing protein 38-like [Actinia tenebrosa]|uniref:BTB and MATH domain-containing protein 38-like n=1 Tax=Actinia tenebrosa TaxID=6105 RepID=A0A6P8J1Z1_ACTTE|nr:BTB and MATH domain-containing protein 38-like [Actinia tenebrosa]
MASPVFKAMLSSNFKEKDTNEIILPGKKINEFVDLLRQLYPLHDGEITLKSIKYIYSLADEYQMTKVMKDCRLFLLSTRKTKENAMDMLLLAQDLEAAEARQQCYDILNKMALTDLESLEGFSELDGPSIQALLLPMVKRLQQCISKIFPEFVGALDGMMYLWSHENNSVKMSGVPSKCPKHKIFSANYVRGRFGVDKTCERIKCDECRAMLKQMAKKAHSYSSPSSAYISENIVSVLEEMMDLIKEH